MCICTCIWSGVVPQQVLDLSLPENTRGAACSSHPLITTRQSPWQILANCHRFERQMSTADPRKRSFILGSLSEQTRGKRPECGMLLKKNGKASSEKITIHINIRYLFMKDKVDAGGRSLSTVPLMKCGGNFHQAIAGKQIQEVQVRNFRKVKGR